MAKILKIKELPRSNKHLLNPFIINEKFILLKRGFKTKKGPKSFSDQFIVVKRLRDRKIYTLSSKYFKL